MQKRACSSEQGAGCMGRTTIPAGALGMFVVAFKYADVRLPALPLRTTICPTWAGREVFHLNQSKEEFYVDFGVARTQTQILGHAPFELTYHAPSEKKDRVLASSDDGVLTIPADDAMYLGQLAFIESVLQPGDKVYGEMGSGMDGFTVACLRQGASVFRVPPRVVKLWREERGIAKEDTVAALQGLAELQPDAYYEVEEKAAAIARLLAMLQTFYFLQKRLRIPTHQRALTVERQARFLYETGSQEEELALAIQKTGLDAIDQWEAEWLKRLDKETKHNPFIRDYLLPIPGVGPRISARIVGTISDIRRFPSVDHLVSYLGYDVHTDPETGASYAPRRRRGEELGFHPNGQQGIWGFIQWVVMMMPKDEHLKGVFKERKELIAKKHPDSPAWYIHSKACRWLGQRFANYIYHAWRHHLDLRGGVWRGWDILNEAA